MSALLAHLERILVRVHLLGPKAEVIDLQDLLASRKYRRACARAGVEPWPDEWAPPTPPEPPGAA